MKTIQRTHPEVPLALLAAGLFALLPAPLLAGDWYVDDDGDCANGVGSAGNPYCRIQDAIDAAIDGDTIHVAEGLWQSIIQVDQEAFTICPQTE